MKKYRLINNISGWAVFIVAAVTYLMTIEPTASLWDCGEFVASCFKLEVGHPPGNPVFMIMGRFFTLFAGGNVAKVAAMVNSMSALASAFTILFLFWTITHLARKILIKNENQYTPGRVIAVMAAGIVGSVAYSFSDSFWFSAVEGEVYASSAFFTALVFWAILKWEDVADENYADRWLVLIGFLMGLSIGVHLLNLLTIPAIVLVYYFRKFEFSWKGFSISLVTSIVLLSLLMYGIMPGVVTISSKFDWFFVNTLGLPSNSGMVFHVIIIALLFIFAVKFSLTSDNRIKNGVLAIAALFFTGIWVISGSSVLNILALLIISGITWYMAGKSRTTLNTALTVIMVILIGYSANAIIVIRSGAKTPLNENNPSNPFNLLYFLNREQYGERPFLKVPIIMRQLRIIKTGNQNMLWRMGNILLQAITLNGYMILDFLLFSQECGAICLIIRKFISNGERLKELRYRLRTSQGEKKILKKPTFAENMRFMISYQFGYMYFRYFMWNFCGKQNDTQGTGGTVNGNWIPE
jgi:hypothetical protein